jgi:hypothetical protein
MLMNEAKETRRKTIGINQQHFALLPFESPFKRCSSAV